MRALWTIAIALCGICGLACAPVVGSVQLVNADIAVTAAESAGAPKYAVYEFTMAKEYLKKAREESGYSDFAAARVYAEKALKYAETARSRALELSDSGGASVILPEDGSSAPELEPDVRGGPPREASSTDPGQPAFPPSLDEDEDESADKEETP
ncbi:MAG: DUF4398 domain-containing protein [Myxococcota bacterium]